MKTILILALIGLSASIAGTAETNAVRLTPAYLNALAEEMRTNHPALRAVESRAHAAMLNTNTVRTWDDPMFKFGGVTASSRGSKLRDDGDLVYGLEQKLPLFGKAQATRLVAVTGAETEAARATYQFQILRRDLAKAVFRTALADRVVEIGSQDLVWLDTMVATTEERYRAGTATQVELLRVQNERAKRADQLRTETDRRDHQRVSVNRLLNRDLSTPLPRLELPPPAASIAYNQKLLDYAEKFEPRLRVMRREVQQAEASVAATRKSRLPDVSAGIEGRQYSGDGGFREGMFTVSLSLPWFNRGKYRSDVARDEARLQAAGFDAADYQLSVREEVHALTVNIDASRREALLYRDEILPRSRQALESAHANWLASRGMSFDVMEARRMLLEAQLMSARAVSEQYQLLSELVLCCGLGDLEALETISTQPGSSSSPSPKP